MADNAEDMITLTSADQDSGDPNLSGATAPDTEDLVITNNSDISAYEATIGGQTAAGLVYKQVGHRVILMATSVLPEFRGKGVAARLIGGVLDELRRQGKTATITCRSRQHSSTPIRNMPTSSTRHSPGRTQPRLDMGVGIDHASSRLSARPLRRFRPPTAGSVHEGRSLPTAPTRGMSWPRSS